MSATLQRDAVRSAETPVARRSFAWAVPALVGLIVIAAAIPRLWGLGGQPVLYFDSGVYLGEGAFLASAANKAAAALSSGQNVALALQDGVDAHPPDIAKPGHAVLLALSMLVFGKTVLAGALVSAVAGIGTVLLTYALGAVGWNRRVGLLAAVMLAVSGQHLVYSREPLVEADGLFFATVGALVYLKARSWRGLLVAGVFYGLAFSCNNRLSYLPLVFAVVELGRWPGLKGLVRRGLALAGGFLLPLVLIEAAYLTARQLGRAAGARMEWLDYVQQLATFSRMNPPDRIRFDEWPTYFVDVVLMDGPLVLALVLFGIGVLIVRKRWSRADLLLAGSLLVPLVLYSVYSTGEVRMRHFSLALPWVMLAAALGLDWLVRLAPEKARSWLTAAVAGVLVVLAIPRTVDLASPPSGMPALLGYLGDRPVATTNGPVLAYFVGESRTNARLREAFVNTPADLDELRSSYDTIVVDMQAHVFPGELTDRYDRAAPVYQAANGNATWFLADVLEHYGVPWGTWDRLLAQWAAHKGAAAELRVYSLRDL